MKLPNAKGAVVPSRKITHYLLSIAHRDGQHKAEVFRSFGFKLEAWEELASALLNHDCYRSPRLARGFTRTARAAYSFLRPARRTAATEAKKS